MAASKAEYGPILPPGKCFSCGSSNGDRQYVDTGIFNEFWGQFYLCEYCLNEVNEALDIGPNAGLKSKITELELANADGNRAIALVDAFREFVSTSDLLSSNSPVATELKPEGGSSGAKELVGKQGSSDLHGTAISL